MAYFQWKPEIALGHLQIDQDHRQMFLLAEAIVEPLLDSTALRRNGAPLQALITFTRKHFAYEEQLMRSSNYPEAAVHANYHAALLIALDSYCSKLARGSNTNPSSFIAFLWDWLVLHIGSVDRKLVTWLASH